MDSVTKHQNMLACKQPNDRTEIPVYPMIVTWCGVAAGITQAKLLQSNDTWLAAMDKTFKIIGKPDVAMPTSAGDAVFAMSMPVRIPGVDLGDNELYQFIETPNITQDDYKFIARKGWDAFFNPYMMRIQNPPMKTQIGVIARFIKLGINTSKNVKHFNKNGIVGNYDYAMMPVFDMLSLQRSMSEFIYDIFDDGDSIHDALRRATPELNKSSITNTKRFRGSKICVYAMRSSCSFLSPELFEEYAWPYLKQTIENFWKAGIISILHADGDWLPVLKYLHEVPKGSVHIELDSATDIFKAYSIVDRWHSIRGDVPAPLFAFGSPDDVSEYCEKLITELGMRGGFMLGSGCEVPLNAKAENIKAMIDSVRK